MFSSAEPSAARIVAPLPSVIDVSAAAGGAASTGDANVRETKVSAAKIGCV